MEAIDACAAKPSGPGNPWLAYAALYRDPLGYLTRAAHKHGDIVHLKIRRKSDFLLNHPDLVRAALLDHENLRRCVHRPLRRVLGTGLLTCRGERHKKQRALLQTMFNRERIAALGDVMVDQITRWTDRWRDGASVDMAEEMTDLAISISGKALFNVDFGLKAAELRNALVTVLHATRFKNLALASRQFEKLSLPSHRRFARAAEKLDTEIRTMIAERLKGACEGPDLLSLMVRLRKQSRKGITEQKIRDQILTFFMVGNETPTTGLMWTWYLIAENPDVATKLHNEVDHVLGDRLPSGQDLDRLRYTRMVFAESNAAVYARLAHDPPGSARCEDKWLRNPQRIVRACQPVRDASRRAILPRPGTVRSRALDARSGRGAPEVFVLSIWRRQLAVYRRRLCLDARCADDSDARPAMADAARAGPPN